jgi:hypothetical protein
MSKQFSITLETLNTFLERKYYFSKERFHHYFSIIGCNDREIKGYWEIFERFPKYQIDEIKSVIFVIDNILNFPFPPEIEKHEGTRLYYEAKENKKKVFYFHENQIKEIIFNLNEERDIILYAEFIRQGHQIIVAVDLVESFYEKSKTWFMFDGDIFTTKEKWNGRDDGEVIVCTRDGYRKLLYTTGRGYVRNGKPDYDDRCFSHYKISMKDHFRNIGNIYADLSFLIEKSVEDEDTEVESE